MLNIYLCNYVNCFVTFKLLKKKNCCVNNTQTDKPSCLAENTRLINLFERFFKSLDTAQSSKIIKVFVPENKSAQV